MHFAFVGLVLVYLLVLAVLVAGVLITIGYLFRKGWDRAGKPPP